MTWIFFLNQHPGSCSFFQLLKCFAVCTLQLIRTETSIQYSSQIRAIVYNDHEKIIFLFILFFGHYLYIYITQNKILGLTRQHKIAWKSGRKFILKFSPQADFNFVQPWKEMWFGYNVGCTMGLLLAHSAWQIDWPSNGSMSNSYSFQPVGPWMDYSVTDLRAEGCLFFKPSRWFWHLADFYPRPVLAFRYCRCLRVYVCVCVSVCPSIMSLSER